MSSSLSPSVFVPMLEMNLAIRGYMWYTLKNGNTRYTHIYSQSSVTKCLVRVTAGPVSYSLHESTIVYLDAGKCLFA